MAQQPYKIVETLWLNEWVIKRCVGLKVHSVNNNQSWIIHTKASPYKYNSKHCDLCLSEKVFIICANPDTLLS